MSRATTQGDPPFRGNASVLLWMPVVPHDQVVDPAKVIHALTAHGWSADSDLVSHSPTLCKNDINTIVTITHPPSPGETLGAHVIADVDGHRRDTFDHRTDRSVLPVDVHGELRPTWRDGKSGPTSGGGAGPPRKRCPVADAIRRCLATISAVSPVGIPHCRHVESALDVTRRVSAPGWSMPAFSVPPGRCPRPLSA
jgi:hypothetical protein